MGLRADRQIDSVEIGFYLNEVASVGVVASISTATSGSSLDGTTSLATISANSSGCVPIGVLLTETVDIDLTRLPVNWHKSQAVKGDKVAIVRKGWVVTDQTTGTITAGPAVLASSGAVMSRPAITSWNQVANPSVGRFLSTKDENGYVRLFVDL